MARARLWSAAKVRALGVTTDLVTAGSVLGVGRTTSYRMAQQGQFPVPVRRVGRRYLVMVAHLLQTLGIDPDDGHGPRGRGLRPDVVDD